MQVEEEETVFSRNLPRSESAMARLEQTTLRKKSYLQTKPHSKSVKAKSKSLLPKGDPRNSANPQPSAISKSQPNKDEQNCDPLLESSQESHDQSQGEGQKEGQGQEESESLLRAEQKDSTSSSRDSGIHKSRSSFLDETEAKVNLYKFI